MDTSVKNLISMGPLEDSFIYYDLGNQVFYSAKQGMNYSAIAAPIAVFSLQRLSKLLNQNPFGDVLLPFQSDFLYPDVSVFGFRDHSPCQIYPTQHEDR